MFIKASVYWKFSKHGSIMSRQWFSVSELVSFSSPPLTYRIKALEKEYVSCIKEDHQ